MAEEGNTVNRRIVVTSKIPKPKAPYSQAVVVDKTVYLSGLVGLDPSTEQLAVGGIEPETEQALKNMGEVLKAAGTSYGNVGKVTVLLADIKDWPTVNGIYAKSKKQKEEAVTVENKSGIYIFPNGDRYEGEFQQTSGANGSIERSGKGCHRCLDGTVYSGTWVKDMMDGEGVMRFPSGACYQSGFTQNKFHGHGRYVWPNGSMFEGCFVENKMDGSGEFTDTEGQIWSGNFFYKAAVGLRFKLNMNS